MRLSRFALVLLVALAFACIASMVAAVPTAAGYVGSGIEWRGGGL